LINELIFEEHINNIYKRASAGEEIIKRVRPFVTAPFTGGDL